MTQKLEGAKIVATVPEPASIPHLKEILEGRRILKVELRVYNFGPATYPVLFLDDGSEVILLNAWGNPPIAEQEKGPWRDPILWEGD